jgi:hypothetical protein
MVGTNRSDEVHLGGAAHACDLRSVDPCDLYGERTDASRRADNKYVLSVLDPTGVAKAL